MRETLIRSFAHSLIRPFADSLICKIQNRKEDHMSIRNLKQLWIGIGVALMLVGLVIGLPMAARAQGPAPQSVSATVGTTFTYQGHLTDGGSPANGNYDFQFKLWNASTGGSQVGSPVTQSGVSVSDGLFTVQLDFGDVFDGTALWLEVGVKKPSDSSYTTLGRQALTATPYAAYALKAPWSGLTGVPAGLNDGDDNTTYTAGMGLTLSGGAFSLATAYRLPQGCASGQIAEWNAGTGQWDCGNDDVGSGGGGNAWLLTGNAGTNPSSNFLGTTDNVSLTLAVNGTAALRLVPNATSPNLIGGHSGNSVTYGVMGATIGGGGASGTANTVTDDYGTVGGGRSNQAGDNAGTTTDASYATVGGGWYNQATITGTVVGGGQWNTASGEWATVGGGWNNAAGGLKATVAGGYINHADGSNSFVGGGYHNTIDTTASYSTIGGGWNNSVSAAAQYATIGGGYDNTASGNKASTVAGGYHNTAGGDYATVGGGKSNTASGYGAFVGGGGYNGISTNGNQALAIASTIGGGYENTVNVLGSYATLGGGYGNVISGTYAFIGGGESNVAGNGSHATVGGGQNNEATGSDAFVGGGNTNKATGSNAVVGGGNGNKASNSDTTVSGGKNNIASAADSTVGGGRDNTASSGEATVGGGENNTASGQYSTVPGGWYGEATLYGQMAYASGRFASAGDAQYSLYVMRGTTTDAGTWHDLHLDGSTAMLTIASGRTMVFDILIVGRSSAGQSAGYTVQGVIENVSGVTAFIGTPTVTELGEDDIAWGAQVVADNTNNALSVQVQGNTGDNIGWVAVVRTAEVAY
jgi:hypothetical protein